MGEVQALTSKGVLPVPYGNVQEGVEPLPEDYEPAELIARMPWLMGQCAGAIQDVQPAKAIVEGMVSEAAGQAEGKVFRRPAAQVEADNDEQSPIIKRPAARKPALKKCRLAQKRSMKKGRISWADQASDAKAPASLATAKVEATVDAEAPASFATAEVEADQAAQVQRLHAQTETGKLPPIPGSMLNGFYFW